MPIVKPRILSRGEIHELQRLQTIYKQRMAKLPQGVPYYYRPKRLDSAV